MRGHGDTEEQGQGTWKATGRLEMEPTPQDQETNSFINIIRDLKAAFNLDFTAVSNKHPFLLKSVRVGFPST